MNVCKEQICAYVKESSLNIDCDDIKSALTKEISFSKFKTWFDSKITTFTTKQNQHIYFKKAFVTELQKGTFDIDEISLDTTSLITALRNKGVSVLSDDTAYIEIMWLEIIASGMSIDDAKNLNHQIVDYMKSGQTIAEYVNLVKRSNALKGYQIDWNKIQTRYEEEIELWDKALEKLNEENYG